MRSLLTLSVLLALIREDKGEKPAVSLLPRFPDVFVGDDITLICKRGNGTIKWFINGKPKSHQDSPMLLTAVTSKDNGEYQCERGGSKSDPYILTVEELEPHAQLSPSIGGAVMTKGDGRNLVLQVDDDPNGWKCFVWRGESGFTLGTSADKMKNRAVIIAELNEAKRATFWCKNGRQRSNAVTLKMTELKVMLDPPAVPALLGESVALRCAVWGGKADRAVFYKDNKQIATTTEDTYIITNATQDHAGQYSCHATYRYSHISAEAVQQEGDSDAQELKVIGGPPAPTVDSTSPKSLECFCRDCPSSCTSYCWYQTFLNDSFARQRLPENTQIITVEEGGLFSCRMECGKGFSRFSNIYSYKGTPKHTHTRY
ncbi:high affinity immunoglobulin gamma Fc receptor I-like [Rhinichthys klamathensis goyatoka]|uniref:high affinity immunoglobulin gamma Fc receptor I-like n=1 Tax=Rhinichthys klamathensis goyatoka TaxID=3034132 RepID=UPI0024B51EB7|nr:high affinity immunoglobulin gamma Fc receptor I-like [Rhinichthys klamathensis goyatoka]